jgi:hypothetical protein
MFAAANESRQWIHSDGVEGDGRRSGRIAGRQIVSQILTAFLIGEQY